MGGAEPEFGPVVPPWDDHEDVGQDEVLRRMNQAVEEAQRAGATEAARLAVIAVGNHVWQSPMDWQQVIDKANSKLDEIEDATTRSRRWG